MSNGYTWSPGVIAMSKRRDAITTALPATVTVNGHEFALFVNDEMAVFRTSHADWHVRYVRKTGEFDDGGYPVKEVFAVAIPDHIEAEEVLVFVLGEADKTTREHDQVSG